MDLRTIIKYTVFFIFLALFQFVILDNIQLTVLGLRPYFYVLLIILLPFETPNWITLFIAFAIGLIMDFFNDTPGIHSSATVFMTFVRPFVLNALSPRDGYEAGTLPRIHFFGFTWFLKYSILLVFSHSLMYFMIEKFSFIDFHITLIKISLTTIFTLVFVIISQYFIFRKE